mgnify:FL=1
MRHMNAALRGSFRGRHEHQEPLQVHTLERSQLSAEWRAAWDALDQEAAHCPCPRVLAETGAGDALRVVVVIDDEGVLGVWPLKCVQSGGRGVARRAGGAVQVYDGPTLHRRADPGAVLATLWAEVCGWWDIDVVELPAFVAGSPLLELGDVVAAANPAGSVCRLHIGGVNLTATDAWMDGMRLECLLDESERWEAMVWALDPALGVRFSPALLDQLFSLTDAPGCLQVFALMLDNERVAVQLGMRDGPRFVCLHTAEAPDLHDCGALGLLMIELAGWCRAHGMHTLDFGEPLPEEVPGLGMNRRQVLLSATVQSRRGLGEAQAHRRALSRFGEQGRLAN